MNRKKKEKKKNRPAGVFKGNGLYNRIRVPKVPFPVFDKLKNEIENFIVRFCFYLNMKNETQIFDYHFHV